MVFLIVIECWNIEEFNEIYSEYFSLIRKRPYGIVLKYSSLYTREAMYLIKSLPL